MDINEEIKNLTKNFQELVEGRKEGESTEDFKHRLAQEQTDKKYGDYVNSLKKAIYSKQHDKKHGYKDESSGSIRTKKYNVQAFQNYSKFNKASNIDLKNGGFEPNSLSREEIKDRIEDDTDQLKREMRADNNSYNSTMQQILDLTEAYANLLEAKDQRGGAQKEVNKITRTKKDKNGEPIEVVSVADELFPYKGTAKEQYNQKILAKINDMIEGTATLDDLIQLVRSKKPAVNVKESLQETLDKMMAVTEEIINEKNANKAKRKAYEINQAERKQGELEYDPYYRKDAGSVKYANQMTIRELKKIKPTNHTQGQALKSAQLSLAQQTRDTLGRKDHPDNPYKKPFVWAKGYKNLYGNLNQKAFERKGYGNFKIKKDSDSPVKGLIKTSIEQEKKIKPNLPKPTEESLQETLDKMMIVAEAIKDNVKYHFTGTDGSAVFSYKGNDYSYTPGKKSNKLIKHGPSKDTRGPVTKAIDDANTTFDNARQEKYGTERLKRTANKKLNKLVKDLEKTEGKNSFPAKTTPEIEKAVKTANNLTDKSLAADKKFTEVNKAQKKDSESGLVSGLKTEDTEIYNTKKGDSIGFKPVVKKN